jgi:hypothetical protein
MGRSLRFYQQGRQLATFDGHILRNLVNREWLRKLDANERKKYTGDFWDASERLKLHDRRARDRSQLQNLDVELKKATLENLEAQKLGKPAALTQIAEVNSRRQQVQEQPQSYAESACPSSPVPPEPAKRVRRLPSRYRDA